MRILDRPSPNFNERPRGTAIDTIILHYTGMKTMRAALDRLRDPDAKVSSHYMIDEDGATYRLVEDRHRAWHAGASTWRGETNMNDRSIGIELVNPGHEHGYRAFPASQMKALISLCQNLISSYPIEPSRILAHSDIAPDRKQDPGELFDWRYLAGHGIGAWPDNEPAENEAATAELLQRYGYHIGPTLKNTIAAFQRHFLPEDISGQESPEFRRRLLRLIFR